MGLLTHADRRTSRRHSLDQVPGIVGVKVDSADVSVINISTGGILFDCRSGLRPGFRTALEILQTDTLHRIRALVVRSQVSAIEAKGVRYRVAVAFEKELAAIADAIENANRRLRHPDAISLGVAGSVSSWEFDGAALHLDPALALNEW